MDKAAPKVKEPSMAKDDRERQARLAEALRANLRRRKAQNRDQSTRAPQRDETADSPYDHSRLRGSDDDQA